MQETGNKQLQSQCLGSGCPKTLFGDLPCVRCPHNPDPDAYPAVSYTLPWPPSVNAYWRYVQMGSAIRMLISAKGRAYKRAVAYAVLEQCAARRQVLRPMNGRLAICATFCPPTRGKRDLDNFCKALWDSLTDAKVWHDDEQVDFSVTQRGPVVKNGKVDVVIRRIAE